MKRTIAAVVAASVLLLANLAVASEQSKILYSRGLVELNELREREALELFEAAVAADASDPLALYYRGVTRGRLGDTNGAITDLEAALQHRPDLSRAALELGAALLRAERFAEAASRLHSVTSDPEVGNRATLLEGIARLRLGELDAAERLLRAAGDTDDQRVPTLYYRAVVEYQRGYHHRARSLLREVIAADSESATAVEAKALLEQIGGEERPYHLNALTGFQYDSNVLLAPTGDAVQDDLGISGEADGRAVFGAGARWAPVRTDFGRVQVGYDFFQSLHFDLSEFDIQSHGIGGDIAGARGAFDWGVYGWSDFHFLDGEKFLSRLTFLPWLGWRANESWRTEISARLRNDDFYGDDYGVRDASQGLYGLRQFYHVSPTRFAWIGYRYDVVDSTSNEVDSRRFEFYGHEFETGIYWELLPQVAFEADYSYRSERYDSASKVNFIGAGGLLPRREDDAHRGQISVRLDLTEHFSLVQGVSVTDSRSTQGGFEYDRIVGSVALEAKL